MIECAEVGACSLVARLIVGRLFPEGCDVEEWPFFSPGVLVFDVVDRKYQ